MMAPTMAAVSLPYAFNFKIISFVADRNFSARSRGSNKLTPDTSSRLIAG
jgi:hypothetical protein